MEESIIGRIRDYFDCPDQDIRSYSPLTLAYIGDDVYDVIIRSLVVSRANRSANDLHKITVKYVKAQTQAEMITALLEELSEEEEDVYRRGRNAKSYTKAKNASTGEYRRATGFEALIGYLYLCGREDRILYLVKTGIEKVGLSI